MNLIRNYVLCIIWTISTFHLCILGVHFNQDHMGMTDDVCNSIGSIESGDLLSEQKVNVFYISLDVFIGFIYNVGYSTHLLGSNMWLSHFQNVLQCKRNPKECILFSKNLKYHLEFM